MPDTPTQLLNEVLDLFNMVHGDHTRSTYRVECSKCIQERVLSERIRALTEPKHFDKAGGFRQYRRKQVAELRPYREGEILSDRVSLTVADRETGSPKVGDMVARNPANHEDQWLVAAAYFAENFELADGSTTDV